ncbi:MAG: hypothetical protein JMDDDDMK_03312 [Acidobacteria bacterium]|nr:hypothetical protein [Acidobacteriota bacterium]
MNTTTTNTQTDSIFNGNPFVGLRPFNSDEGLLFFGRQEQAAELMQKLHRTRFLGIVGSSGCGKSSLIRAGLIPKLKAGFLAGDRDQWRIAIMKPGDAPLRNLAISLIDAATGALNPATNVVLEEIDIAAMIKSLRRTGAQAAVDYLSQASAGSNANLLLLVDQFEELFHFGIETGDPEKRDEAADFVSIMLELSEQRALPVYVVMTMRSDYLGECDNFYGLPEALNRSQYLVPRLTRHQRQQAIEGPISLFGQQIAPRLIDRVLNDVGEQSDQLPVMQHAMMRTWDNWRQSGDAAIDYPHYERAGTIKQALSHDADSALIGMSDEERKITERMFQALTNVDTRNRRVRRQTHLSELQEITGATREQLLKIINRFRGEGRSFLTVEDDKLTADPLVDISHESLIRQWKQLDKWLNDESDWRDIYVRLAEDAARFKKKQVDLWRDPQLQIALNWYDERKPNKAWAERYCEGYDAAIEFMDQSRKERDAEAERERARRERELADALEREEAKRKQLFRNRLFSFFLGLLSVSSLVATGYALRLNAQAESAKANLEKSNTALKASEDNLIATKDRLVEQASKNADLLTALEVRNKELNAEKIRAITAQRAAERSADEARGNAILAIEQAERAEKQSAISSQRVAQLLGLHSAHLTTKGENNSEAVEKRALLAAQSLRMKTSGGESLPTVEGDSAARAILSLAPRIVKAQRIDAYGGAAALSQDAKSLVTLTSNKDAQLMDTATGKTNPALVNLPDGVTEISLSRDGKFLAASSIVATVEDVPGANDKNQNAAYRSARSAIQIQTFRTVDGQWFGQPIALQIPAGVKQNLVVSPDGSRLVTFTNAEAQLWNTASGAAVGAQRPAPPQTQEPVTPTPQRRAPNQSGKSQVQTSMQEIRGLPAPLADTDTPAQNQYTRPLAQTSGASWSHKVIGAAFSHDGKKLATIHTSELQTCRGCPLSEAISRLFTWDAATGAQIGEPIEADSGRKKFFSFAAYSPDGKYLLTILREIAPSTPSSPSPRTIELRDAQTGKVVAATTDLPDCKEAVFSGSGGALAVTTEGNLVVKLAIANDNGSVTLVKESLIYYGGKPDAVAFSEDGRYLTVVNADGEMLMTETRAESVVATVPLENGFADPIIAYASDGRLLITDDGRKIKAWNSPDKPSEDFVLGDSAKRSSSMAVAFSRNGEFLAAIGEAPGIWDIGKRRLINQPDGDRIRLAGFSKDGGHWALISENGAAVVMSANNNIPPLRLPDAGATTKAVAISAAEESGAKKVKHLAIADRSGAVRIRELIHDEAGRAELGASLTIRPDSGQDGEITALAFINRDHRLLATAIGAEVKLWDIKTGRQFGATLEHSSRINDLAVGPSVATLAAACQDGKIVIWAMNQDQVWERKPPLDFAAPVEKIVFNRTGAFLIAAGSGKAQLWNAATSKQIGTDMEVGRAVDLMMQETSARAIWVLGDNGTLRLWRPEGGGQPMGNQFRGAAEGAKAFFNPAAGSLVTGSVSFPIVRELSGRFLPGMPSPNWTPTVALSPDGKYLAGSYGGAITIRRTDDLRQFHSISPVGEVTNFSFTPAGNLATVVQTAALDLQTAASGIGEQEDTWTIEIRNPATGELIGKTDKIRDSVDAVAFGPTEDIFATLISSEDDKGRIVIWKKSGSEIRPMKGKQITHGYSLDDLVFSPDGRFLVAAGADGAHIWEVALGQDEVVSRQEVADIPDVKSAPVFSRDGEYLAIVSGSAIKIAHWRPDNLADDVCARLKRNFTQDEWQQYLTDERPYERTCRNWEAHQSVIDEAINLAKAGERTKAESLFKVMRNLKNSAEEEADWHYEAAQMLDNINAKMPWRKLNTEERRAYVGAPANEDVIRRGLREAIPLFDNFKRFNQQHPHSFNPNRVSGAQNREARNTPARILNGLCWYGSLFGYAGKVKDACHLAVEFDPKFTEITDSRGLVRALTGELPGAIADFEVFAKTATEPADRVERRRWAEALKKCVQDRAACQFPFTEEGLKKIRAQ